MDRVSLQEPAEVQNLATPSFRLPDATSIMEGVLGQAMDSCARRLNLEGPQAVLELLRRQDATAQGYCHYHLAQRVAEALGTMDDNVQSVSMYEFDATPEDRALGQRAEGLPIHLIVWVGRRTSAFKSLVAALDRALVKDYAELIGPRRLGHVLDVQVIDDADVESRRGIASLLTSLHNRPIRLWER